MNSYPIDSNSLVHLNSYHADLGPSLPLAISSQLISTFLALNFHGNHYLNFTSPARLQVPSVLGLCPLSETPAVLCTSPSQSQ